MKIEQLYYLTEAVKFKSISIAARENYVPTSTVSSAISRLEKEMEISLITRSNKGISATAAGQQVVEKSQQLIALFQDIQTIGEQKNAKYPVTISAMPAIVDTLLVDTFLQIEQQQLPLTLRITTNEPSTIIQNVQLGHSSVGIVFDNAPIEYEGLNCYPLFEDEYCLFVGQQSPFFHRDIITIAEALMQPHIAYQTEYDREENILSRMIAPFGRPHISMRVDNTETMRRIIANSTYVAFFPHFTIYQDAYIESGKLRALPLSDADLKLYVSFIESNHYKDSHGNQQLLQILKNHRPPKH